MGKISNYYFLADNTRLFYHNAIDMLLSYVLYETKKLLTIPKMYITIINILVFIINTAIAIIIIIIIMITITINIINISTKFVYVKSDNYLLQFRCHLEF